MSDERKPREEQPETALEEVLKEMSDAAHRTDESADRRRRRGEAGEAITQNERDQEESEGE